MKARGRTPKYVIKEKRENVKVHDFVVKKERK